jgi:hypothetical protein
MIEKKTPPKRGEVSMGKTVERAVYARTEGSVGDRTATRDAKITCSDILGTYVIQL